MLSAPAVRIVMSPTPAIAHEDTALKALPKQSTHELMAACARVAVQLAQCREVGGRGQSPGPPLSFLHACSPGPLNFARPYPCTACTRAAHPIHHACHTHAPSACMRGCTSQVFTMLGVREFLPSVRMISWLEGQLCVLRPELCIR